MLSAAFASCVTYARYPKLVGSARVCDLLCAREPARRGAWAARGHRRCGRQHSASPSCCSASQLTPRSTRRQLVHRSRASVRALRRRRTQHSGHGSMQQSGHRRRPGGRRRAHRAPPVHARAARRLLGARLARAAVATAAAAVAGEWRARSCNPRPSPSPSPNPDPALTSVPVPAPTLTLTLTLVLSGG